MAPVQRVTAELDALAVMGHVYVIDQRFLFRLKKENPANFGLPFTGNADFILR